LANAPVSVANGATMTRAETLNDVNMRNLD
jgi:hypothetical protein